MSYNPRDTCDLVFLYGLRIKEPVLPSIRASYGRDRDLPCSQWTHRAIGDFVLRPTGDHKLSIERVLEQQKQRLLLI